GDGSWSGGGCAAWRDPSPDAGGMGSSSRPTRFLPWALPDGPFRVVRQCHRRFVLSLRPARSHFIFVFPCRGPAHTGARGALAVSRAVRPQGALHFHRIGTVAGLLGPLATAVRR